MIAISIVFILVAVIIGGNYGGFNEASENGSQNSENNDTMQESTEGGAPSFTNVSVHDPSIIKEGDTYYAFGTHIEAAHSTDLMNWISFTNGYSTPDNALYGDLSENLAESFNWAGEDDSDSQGGYAVWAPDIFWNDNYINDDGSTGAYMIYYSASSTYIRSALGYAVSQDIEGPYEYVDTIVYSGFTEGEAYDENSDVNKDWSNTNIPDLIDDGQLSGESDDWFHVGGAYNNQSFPNAIDANLFYDEEGTLWMNYGSWSGGIFLLEIDEETGKPIYPGEDGETADGRLIDRYFGINIAGGNGESGEGPYLDYDEERGYYYLYVTYGWLGLDGGYNMRLFRATDPEGPYLDANDQDAVLPDGARNPSYGYKLMGNFEFDLEDGGSSGSNHGYVSPGHNSVYSDSDTDNKFLAFHSRFPNRGEEHELRIHQLFMTDDDWPVVAPYRYSGETLENIDEDDIVGDYQFINHGTDNDDAVKSADLIHLHDDQSVSGTVEGTWEKVDGSTLQMTLDGVEFDGIFLQQWDDSTEKDVMTFTAMSNQNETIWGSKFDDSDDEVTVSRVKDQLSLGDSNNISSNLNLPQEGARNTEISWASSDSDLISADGEVTRPNSDAGEVDVTLTATITRGDAMETKDFELKVQPMVDAELTAHFPFDENLGDQHGDFEDGSETGNRIDNTDGSISFADGREGQAAVFDGDSGVRLPNGLISSSDYSVSLWVNPEELTTYTTTFFGARDEDNWVSLVPRGPDGEETFVVSEFPNIFTTSGGSFSLGVNWWDPPFKGMMDELRIYDGAIDAEEIAELAE
ncbi:lipocalin-like domain-containing protein [Salipaludibacillus sp. HK11]|uniref:lipocalin-like domain-containing protein n=1 Tax=Salipaludibacillus sp. HK11 TaxID=3394320 RepID=UPI0039FBADFC